MMNPTGVCFARIHAFFSLLIVCFATLLFCLGPAWGSTIWGASGDSVDGGGTIIALNLDAKPAEYELRLVIPREGFSYLGLFLVRAQKGQGPVAAVNDKGLAVATGASEIGHGKKKKSHEGDLVGKLASGYETVDAALSSRKIFPHTSPSLYAVADRSKAALIEVRHPGKTTVKIIDKGTFPHTRPYPDERSPASKEGSEIKSGTSHELSQTEGTTGADIPVIERLLSFRKEPLSPDDFLGMAKHRGFGAEEGVLKVRSTRDKSETLATWIIYLPKTGSPELYVTFYDHGEILREVAMKLDRPFWSEGIE